jgi:endonuclease-8
MPDGEPIHRTAAALRTALVGRKMIRFDAPRLVGAAPTAGRTIERIETSGKRLDIEWDDGVILHTRLRRSGCWHLYRPDEPWRRPSTQLRVAIEVRDWVAVCFNAPVAETYREPDLSRHPGFGGLGPDVSRADADLGRGVDLLLSYRDPEMALGEVLLDQRVLAGVGNVYRAEALWACELSPFARVGELRERDAVRLVNLTAKLVRANLQYVERVSASGVPAGLAVYGRTGQRCHRCAATVEARETGEPRRVLYWCPGCQVRLAPQRPVDDTSGIDPHPAAAKFLADLPWRRAGGF